MEKGIARVRLLPSGYALPPIPADADGKGEMAMLLGESLSGVFRAVRDRDVARDPAVRWMAWSGSLSAETATTVATSNSVKTPDDPALLRIAARLENLCLRCVEKQVTRAAGMNVWLWP